MKKYIITESYLLQLLEQSLKLSNLECAGVDNWSGYGESFDFLEEEGFDSYREQAKSLLIGFRECEQ